MPDTASLIEAKAWLAVAEMILPPAPVETGKMKAQPVSGAAAVLWEQPKQAAKGGKPGAKSPAKPGKGPDVKVVCGLSYNLLSFDLLAQKYLEKPLLKADVILAPAAVGAVKVDVMALGKMALTQSSLVPEGEVTFEVKITTKTGAESGKLTLSASGAKISGKEMTIKP